MTVSPATPRYGVLSSRASLPISMVIIAVLFGWGAWERRWIADDGLIVLRTVRNLLAGNGPVFNAGERVESNTSTLWTYLIYVVDWVTGARLEYVALTLALICSLGGVALAMAGTARLYRGDAGYVLGGRRVLLLPAGVVIYIALPPARDFATSGLEMGLVLGYLGLLWYLMVRWSEKRTTHVLGAAFVAGLSVLVRPELALVGGLAGLLLLAGTPGWWARVRLVIVAALVPGAYQIFRMGYYGLIVPNTAVAKDAAGSKWGQGFTYLHNLSSPYALWLPLILAIALAVVITYRLCGTLTLTTRPTLRRAWSQAPELARSRQAVIIVMMLGGLLQGMYWVRQGGDFMHGRVLLAPLFCLLLPVSVIPLGLPERGNRREVVLAAASAVVWMGIGVWAVLAANSAGMANPTKVGYSGIVDERRFYIQATGHGHPLLASDYLDYPRIRAMTRILDDLASENRGGLLLASANYDTWDVVPEWDPPLDGAKPTKTVFFLNLGMSSMNVGLDVRVIDAIGLAYPLASHTDRLTDGRIGHDKDLFTDWAIADSPVVPKPPAIPGYIDQDWVTQATVALRCPPLVAMQDAYREPLTKHRFLYNVIHSYTFTKYRFNRVPIYEIDQCGLVPPPVVNPPYTGFPASGP